VYYWGYKPSGRREISLARSRSYWKSCPGGAVSGCSGTNKKRASACYPKRQSKRSDRESRVHKSRKNDLKRHVAWKENIEGVHKRRWTHDLRMHFFGPAVYQRDRLRRSKKEKEGSRTALADPRKTSLRRERDAYARPAGSGYS